MSGLLPPRRRRVEMNLLPLIDVLVMLIFFAFVTMQFRSVQAINVTLPKFETSGRNALTDAVTISVSKEGDILFNNQRTNEAEIESLVIAQSRVDPEVTVMIKIDKDAPVHYLALVMDLCRKHGLAKVRLQSRTTE